MRLDQRWILALLIMVGPLLAQGQEIADRKPGEFERVRVFGKMNVRMIPGSEPHVHIEAKGVSLEKIRTSIEDGELKIKLSRLFASNAEVYVEITHGELKGIEALGDAEVIFDKPVIAPGFDIQSTMGSNVQLAIEARHLDLKAYQGGQVQVKGSTDSLEAFVNTGGILSGTDLVCQRVDIRMNTGGKGEVTVEKELEASVNTGSDFSYFGRPATTDIRTSFGGTVSAWDEE
ncbi:MAG: DUF2807 domain-containing protein [Bacteroidales bacterium]|nr:DUF2807 domain-containing protein [Bacteroidales bacterium]